MSYSSEQKGKISIISLLKFGFWRRNNYLQKQQKHQLWKTALTSQPLGVIGIYFLLTLYQFKNKGNDHKQ